MAIRLGRWVVEGEIFNTRRNQIHGWIQCAGPGIDRDDEANQLQVIRVELTGNLSGELANRHFRFRAKQSDPPSDGSTWPTEFQQMQGGVIGETAWRIVRVPLGDVKEFYELSKKGLHAPETQLPSLYLEWYSQNGRVVIELEDPLLEFSDNFVELADPDPEPLPDDIHERGVSIDMISRNPDGSLEVESFSNKPPTEDSDVYGLFDPDLEQQLSESVRQHGESIEPESSAPGKRSWDDVIPGLDPKTKAMYEQWDEVVDGTRDEPLSWLFDSPLQLPKPDQLQNESEAWSALSSLLAAMALRGVVFDMCEHITANDAYRMLVETILPDARVHAESVSIGFTQHYSSSDDCEICQSIFDEEYRDESNHS